MSGKRGRRSEVGGRKSEVGSQKRARINFRPPGKDDPGYLRRMIQVTELQADFSDLQTQIKEAGAEAAPELLRRLAATMRTMVDLVADYAVVEDGHDPKEALLSLSQTEFERLFGAFRGDGAGSGAAAPLSGPPNGAGSATG